jgi:aldehyde dehydrogenase (NAD+)
MKNHDNIIGGARVPPHAGAYAENVNPADTRDILGLFAASGAADAEAAIEAAKKAFPEWAATPGPSRGRILFRFADLLEKNRDEAASILTREEGKVLSESKGEIQRAVDESRFMAGEASRLSGNHFPSEQRGIDVARTRVPLGPVGVITPWNFPVVSPVRKISPALACGDTVVFKPATLTPWTGLRLAELYAEAGVPAGVVNTVTGPGAVIGRALAESKKIRGITFTGSTAVGRTLLRACAENLTKVQLEMGGKNPALVFEAESLSEAARGIVSAAFASSGQRCTAISRVIVSRKEHDELVALMAGLIRELKVGNGMDPGVTMGPLVSEEQVETVQQYIRIAVQDHARIVAGGAREEARTPGHFFQPTLITGLRSDSPLAREEIFGPVLSVLVVDSVEEGIALCNDTPYGLGACVFTRYLGAARAFAQSVDAGMIHINHGTASQPHVPFGGVKESGFGPWSIGSTAQDFYMTDKVIYTR